MQFSILSVQFLCTDSKFGVLRYNYTIRTVSNAGSISIILNQTGRVKKTRNTLDKKFTDRQTDKKQDVT